MRRTSSRGTWAAIHRSALNHLMHPLTLTRITDSRLYGNEYPLTEFMTDLTTAHTRHILYTIEKALNTD